jgi:hypothetical protein
LPQKVNKGCKFTRIDPWYSCVRNRALRAGTGDWPRAIIFLGAGDLPDGLHADVIGERSQAGLVNALSELLTIIAQGAFGAGVQDFDAPA